MKNFWLLPLLLCASPGACTRTRATDDTVTGIPSQDIDSTPIADEVGDGPAALGLLPLRVGNRWTYRVEGVDGGCVEGSHVRTVSRQEQVAGRNAFVVTDYCGRQADARFAQQGNQVLQYENAAWRTGLASPLLEERAWSVLQGQRYHWHAIGWVKVQAGLFAKCWERQAEDEAGLSEVYCDGAGVVSVSGPNLRVELTAFSLNDGQLVSRTE